MQLLYGTFPAIAPSIRKFLTNLERFSQVNKSKLHKPQQLIDLYLSDELNYIKASLLYYIKEQAMSNNEDMYTSRLLVEVEAQHWGEPESVRWMVENLLRVPAIRTVKIVRHESNFKVHSSPMEEMVEVEEKK